MCAKPQYLIKQAEGLKKRDAVCVQTKEISFTLTLFTPAYFGISGTGGGHIVPPLSILGLGGVRVPILFGNDLPMND